MAEYGDVQNYLSRNPLGRSPLEQDAECVVVEAYYAKCLRCDWRSRHFSAGSFAQEAASQHQHRTTCASCGGPYDEDTDAWGLCAPCLAIAQETRIDESQCE